eukprot:1191322-Prorocentrum_minimum.AAC.2
MDVRGYIMDVRGHIVHVRGYSTDRAHLEPVTLGVPTLSSGYDIELSGLLKREEVRRESRANGLEEEEPYICSVIRWSPGASGKHSLEASGRGTDIERASCRVLNDLEVNAGGELHEKEPDADTVCNLGDSTRGGHAPFSLRVVVGMRVTW